MEVSDSLRGTGSGINSSKDSSSDIDENIRVGLSFFNESMVIILKTTCVRTGITEVLHVFD